ncbi:MAG: MobA/MobL family protein, partial [Limisphaerales bacterium]
HGAELQDIETLLNAIDRAETQAKSQTALNFTAALPKELSDEERARMVRDFGREHFLRKGIPAIAHIHPPHEHAPAPGQAHDHDEHDAAELDNGNWHVHILAGTRVLRPDGQFGEKHITWDNYREFLEHKRERWAELGARYLENAGFKIEAERWRYGHLTNPQQREKALERGDREWAERKAQDAGKHRGPNADAMERKGIETDLGNASREVQQCNEDRAAVRALKRDLAKLERQDAFDNLKQELTEANKVLAETRRADRAASRAQIQPEPDISELLKRDIAEVDKLIYGGFTPSEMREQLAELDKSLAADLYQHQKQYPNHFRTHRQDQIPPAIAAEMEKLAAADAERDYAQRDPAREQVAWEDKVAKAAIEKEKKDRQFAEPAPQPAPQQDRQQEPARPRFGDQLITRAAEIAMRDTQHGETLSTPAAFRDALEKNRLALACVTPDEAAKSHREGKFAKEVGRYAPVYQAGEIVIMREPRKDENTGGRVHKLDQTKAEDY